MPARGRARARATRHVRRVARGDLREAGSCHRQALDLACQIGSAWDEAQTLAGLGRCALAVGQTAEAADMLRQALETFKRIGAAAEAVDVTVELVVIDAPEPGMRS
jgi:tetratricopeptide (TPR) repeat protein